MVGWLLALYADYFISIKFNIHFSYPAAWQAHSLERCLFCYHGGDWSYFSAYISSLRLWDFWPSQWFLLDPGKDYTGADLGYSWLLPKPFWVMLSVISSYNFAVSLKPRRCKSEQNLCQLLLNILIFKTYMALWEYALFLWSSLTIFLWNHSFKTITVHFFCQENIQNFLGQMLETRDQRMLWWWSLSWNFNQRWHALFCERWLQSSLHQQLGYNAACGVHLSEFTTGRTVAVQALPSHASQHILLQSATWVTDDTLKNN